MKVAIVTGGARGIGAAFSNRLMKMGYNVVISGTTDSKHLNALVDALNEKYPGVKAVKGIGDVSDYSVCESIVQTAIDEFGQLNVLINNAGVVNTGLFADIPKEKYIKCVKVDLLGTMHMSHIAIPYLLKHKRSDIINLSSIMGISAAATNTDYVAAKHGVIGFTRGLACDYADQGLVVNAICPGVTKTDILNNADPVALDAIIQSIPVKKLGDVEDIADVVEFLLNSNYITGQYISPNGGSTMA